MESQTACSTTGKHTFHRAQQYRKGDDKQMIREFMEKDWDGPSIEEMRQAF